MNASERPQYTIDRTVFRDVLLSGLQGDVFFSKQFTHYETEGSQVKAYSMDGTVKTVSLLVGADGVRSRVRTAPSAPVYRYQRAHHIWQDALENVGLCVS